MVLHRQTGLPALHSFEFSQYACCSFIVTDNTLNCGSPHLISFTQNRTQFVMRVSDVDSEQNSSSVVLQLIDTVTLKLNFTSLPSGEFSSPLRHESFAEFFDVMLSYRLVCTENYYGLGCTKFCNETDNIKCDENGDQSCKENYYGPDCTNFCIETGNFVCNENGDRSCTDNYYGPNCDTFCEARDGSTGHYSCDDDGNKVCLPGYQDPSTSCTECAEGADGCSKLYCLRLCTRAWLHVGARTQGL